MQRKRYHVALTSELVEKPIEAIKRLRRITGLGLREAKIQVDEMRPTGKSMLLTDYECELMFEAGFVVMGNTTRPVTVFRQDNGRKIEDIKDLRRCTGFGLREAKDVIDEMRSYNRPIDIGVINEYTVTQLRQRGFTVTGWVTEAFKDNEDLFTI